MGFIKVVFVRPKEACCFVNTRKLDQNMKLYKVYDIEHVQDDELNNFIRCYI